MAPTARLLVLLALLLPVSAAPAVFGVGLWPLPLIGWALLAAVTVVDGCFLLVWVPTPELDVPKRAGVGDRFELSVRVRTKPWVALRARLHVELEAPLRALDAPFELLVKAGTFEHRVPLIGDRRGQGALRALWLVLDGPLRLLRRPLRFPISAEPIAIVPSAQRVEQLALQWLGERMTIGSLVQRLRGASGELDALEPWVAGMDLRSIDWKATARHHSLTARRFRVERNQRIVLSIDAGRLMADPIDGVQRLDHAIHAALLLGWAALRAGDFVGLHAYADEPVAFVPESNGPKHLSRIREACSLLRSRPLETNHFLGLRDLFARLSRRSLIVVLSELVDATMAELMVENLSALARRHLVVFVALDDALTEAPLETEPAAVLQLAAAVVASEIADERRRVIHRLQRAGVEVIHGPPTQATLGLLASYVRIKRQGAIG